MGDLVEKSSKEYFENVPLSLSSDNIPESYLDVENISHEKFYTELVKSASGFVSAELQENLRNTKLLIAGCGSIGNPIAMIATRSGMENITVADPDVVETSNLARQEYISQEVGMNKAQMTIFNMTMINPYIYKSVKSIPEGITEGNVEELVKNSDIIIDGIDIRSSDMMYELHKYASQYKKIVITGYDLAGTAMICVYRYDKENMKPLDGDIPLETINLFKVVKQAYKNGEITESLFLDYINNTLTGAINPFSVPIEQFEQIIRKEKNSTRTPQIGTTSSLVSALAMETIKNILSGKEVKKVITIDLNSSVRKVKPSVLRKVGLMFQTLHVIKKRGKEIDSMLNNLKK